MQKRYVKRAERRCVYMANKCPKCDGKMKKGVIVDRAHMNTPTHPTWVEKIKFKITLTREDRKVQAFCCEKCGFIEQYAEIK